MKFMAVGLCPDQWVLLLFFHKEIGTDRVVLFRQGS